MQSINVRLAATNDLVALADIWYENKVLNQQADTGLSLLPDAKNRWLQAAGYALADARCRMWLVSRDATIQGYVTVWLHDMPPGFTPEQVGCITEMALDLHTASAGAGRALLQAARAWLSDHRITALIVQVPHRQPVQQAFWRGLGARDWMDVMWLTL